MTARTMLVLAVALAGCRGPQHTGSIAAYEETEQATPVEPAPEPPPAPASTGTIARAELVEVLDAGPGRFLGGIDVEAVFQDRKFSGWRVLAFEPRDPRLSVAPIRPGDVIRQVNGRPIARPEQLQAVWESLRTADELVIEGDREGAPFELRYVISSAP